MKREGTATDTLFAGSTYPEKKDIKEVFAVKTPDGVVFVDWTRRHMKGEEQRYE